VGHELLLVGVGELWKTHRLPRRAHLNRGPLLHTSRDNVPGRHTLRVRWDRNRSAIVRVIGVSFRSAVLATRTVRVVMHGGSPLR
jgi:hypothetical protein